MRKWLALVAAAALAGCGTAHAAPVPKSGLLPPSAVAGLVATTSPPVTVPLSAADLAKDSTAPDFAGRLAGWGYAGGWQRTFQGESRHLTLVVSRSLLFSGPGGAAAFASYVHRQLPFFYKYALIKAATIRGHGAWVILPPMCACHMATPLVAGVAVSGDRVSWLEINGPDATPDLLIRLLNGRLVE